MKRISLALATAMLSMQAFAQTQFPAGTLWGNTTASSGLPTTVPVPNCPTGALNYTSGVGIGCNIGGINSITSTGGTLVLTGTTTTNLEINLAHTNIWTSGQTLSGLTLSGITGGVRCLHVDTSGIVSGTASDCGTSSGGISSLTSTGGTLTITGTTAANADVNLTHANTWTGGLTVAPTSGDALTINPTANSYNKGLSITQTSPTSGNVAGPKQFNLITTTFQGDIQTSAQTFGLYGSNVSSFWVDMITGGTDPGAGGPLFSQAISSGIFRTRDTIAGTQSNFPDRIGLIGVCYVNVNHTDPHGCYGANALSQVDSGGVITHLVGMENDMQITGTGTAVVRTAFRATNMDAHVASTLDSAFTVSSTTAGGNWLNGMSLETTGFGQQAIATTGNWFSAESLPGPTNQAITNWANLSNLTVTGKIMNFPNFSVPGAASGFKLSLPISPGSTLQFGAQNAGGTVLQVEGYGAAVQFLGRRADSSSTVPSAVLANEAVSFFAADAHDGAGYNEIAAIVLGAAQTQVHNSAYGSAIKLFTTPLNATSEIEAARFQPSGGLSVGSANVGTDDGNGVIVANRMFLMGVVTLAPGVGSPACVHASGEIYKSSGGTC